MNTPGSSAIDSIRIRSPSSAPPVNGDVGSTATTATRRPWDRKVATTRSVTVDLPAPGGPVSPMRRARPSCGWIAGEEFFEPGTAVLDQRYGAGHGGNGAILQAGHKRVVSHVVK